MHKTVLVTGSSRGIGKAIALYLASKGYDIVVHCRSRMAEAEAVAEEIKTIGQTARIFYSIRMLRIMVPTMLSFVMQVFQLIMLFLH